MSFFNERQQQNLCIVQGCHNGEQSNPSIQYFPVPVHSAPIASAWYKNTMRTDLKPSHLHYVCEQHFEESCFDYVGNGTKVLQPKSLPTLFDLEVFYKMIAYQESNTTIKKTNITFHTSNPEIDGKTLEPILKLNTASDHIKTRLAPTSSNEQEQRENQLSLSMNKTSSNAADHFENKASNRCHVEGCPHNYIARRHRVQLYKISRDPLIARKWLDACGYESVPVSASTATFKVCREHFTPNDFEGPATLRSDAIPSQFTLFSLSLMDKQNPTSSNKRFRSDANHPQNKSTSNLMANNKRVSMTYRANHSYNNRQDEEQYSIQSLSPTRNLIDDFSTQIVTDFNQINEMDLLMNCIDDQLSDVQMSHRPVKALDRTDTSNGMAVKPRNPVGRPRIHPRQPTTAPITRHSNTIDDDIEEIDDWNVTVNQTPEKRPRERDWINGHPDDRQSWAKKTTANNREIRSTPVEQVQPAPQPHQDRSTNLMIRKAPVASTALKSNNIRARDERVDVELYKRSLAKFYGQKPGRNCPLSDYGDYRCRCPLCDDVIVENNIQLIIHLAQHYNSSSKSNRQISSPFEQINTKCSFCQSEFSNPYFLAMHIDDKHWNELKEYFCRICDEIYSSSHQLMRHLNQDHGGLDMPYICEICSFRTSIYADMIYHLDETHKSTRYFVCPYCLITIELPFFNKNLLTVLNGTLAYEHLSMHWKSMDQDRVNQCDKCCLQPVSSIKDHLQKNHLNMNNVTRYPSYQQKNNDGREFYHDDHHRSSTSRFVTSTTNG